MPRFYIEDIKCLERSPCSPGNFKNKVSELLYNSLRANAKVEMVNKDTGEYRIVLQGTLDQEPSKWWW